MMFSTNKAIFSVTVIYDLVENSPKIQVVKRVLCPQV